MADDYSAIADPVEAAPADDYSSIATPLEHVDKTQDFSAIATPLTLGEKVAAAKPDLNKVPIASSLTLGNLQRGLGVLFSKVNPWERYKQSVDEGFKGPIEIPRIEAEGSSDAAQIGAGATNVATGAASGLISAPVAASLLNPAVAAGTAIYSAPRFIAGGVSDLVGDQKTNQADFNSLLKAKEQGFGGPSEEVVQTTPKQSTQQKAEKLIGGALQLAGGVGALAHVAPKAMPKIEAPKPSSVLSDIENVTTKQTPIEANAGANAIAMKPIEPTPAPEPAVPAATLNDVVPGATKTPIAQETPVAAPEPAPKLGPEATKLAEKNRGPEQLNAVKDAIKNPDTVIQYSVWDKEYVKPGQDRVMQYDVIDPANPQDITGGVGSVSRSLLEELGVDLPRAPDSLAPGKYTLDQIKSAIEAEKAQKEASKTAGSDFSAYQDDTKDLAEALKKWKAEPDNAQYEKNFLDIQAQREVIKNRNDGKPPANPYVSTLLEPNVFDKEWKDQGGQGGSENQVIFKDGKVYKRNYNQNLGQAMVNFSGDLNAFKEHIALHNELFPSAKITLEGFSNTSDGPAPVTSQPEIKGKEATPKEIKAYMQERDFVGANGKFTNPDTGIEVSDLRGKNVLKDKEGNLHVIDPVIKRVGADMTLEKPPQEPITQQPNAVQVQSPESGLTNGEISGSKGNVKSISNENVVQAGQQAKPGINTEAARNDVNQALARYDAASDAWRKAVERNNTEKSKDSKEELSRKSVDLQIRSRELLDSSDRLGKAVRASGGGGENAGSQASQQGASSSSERGRTGQSSGKPQGSNAVGTQETSLAGNVESAKSGILPEASQELSGQSKPVIQTVNNRAISQQKSKSVPVPAQAQAGEGVGQEVRRGIAEPTAARQEAEVNPVASLVSPPDVQNTLERAAIDKIAEPPQPPKEPPTANAAPGGATPRPYKQGLTGAGLGIGKAAEFAKVAIGTIDGNIRDVNKRVHGVLRNYEAAKSRLSLQFEDATLPASRLTRQILTDTGNDMVGNLLMSGKVDEAKTLVASNTKYGEEFGHAIDAVRTALDAAHAMESEARTTAVPYIKDYFPRQLISYADLREFLGKDEQASADAAIRKAQQKSESPLTSDQKADVINDFVFQSGRFAGKPGFLKERTIKEINSNLTKFYEPWDVALENYLRKVTNDVTNRAYFGKFDPSEGAIYNPSNGHFGQVIAEEIAAGRLKGKAQDIVIDNLKDRFKQEHQAQGLMAEIGRKVRWAQTAAYLGQVTTAVAQFGDVFQSAYRYGLIDTAKGYANRKITLRDIGLHEGNVETAQFSRNKGLIDKATNQVIKFGIGLADQFNKGGQANAILNHFSDVVRDPQSKQFGRLNEYYSQVFPEQWPKMLKEISSQEFRDGNLKKLPNAQMFVYNELSRIQPINPSGMAQGYNAAHPLAKPFWGLKSYMIKQLDIMREEGYEKLKHKDSVGQGLAFLAGYAAIVAGGQNFAISWLRDKMLNRHTDTEDYFIGGILQLMGLSRYSIMQAKQGEYGKVVAETLLPALSLAKEATNDLGVVRDAVLSRRDAKTGLKTVDGLSGILLQSELIKHFPIIGSEFYNLVGKGATNEAAREKSRQSGKPQPNTLTTLKDIVLPGDKNGK